MYFLLAAVLFLGLVQGTPLDDYVNAPDPSFKWEITPTVYDFPGAKGYMLNVTTQTWLTEKESDHPVWFHQLVVIVPEKIRAKKLGFLWITGGDNGQKPPKIDSEDMIVTSAMAIETGMIGAALFQVPNQPIKFPSDPKHENRKEDALLGYTWGYFFNHTNNPDFILNLPMTKAAVKAMDATEQYVAKHHGHTLSEWLVAGASKRGWTTWTVAAVVPHRCKAIAPLVMDFLNMTANIHHMWRAMGDWTFAFGPYWDVGLTEKIDTPAFAALASIIDPYVYRNRFTMPKFVIDATDDEFFMMDDDHYWWDNMPNEKHRLMCQNAEHSLITAVPEILQAMIAYGDDLVVDAKRPEFTWTMDADKGSIVVKEQYKNATQVRLWHGRTLQKERRDWRWLLLPEDGKCPLPEVLIKKKNICLAPIIWTEETLIKNNGVYTANFKAPKEGWEAWFVELKYHSEVGKFEYRLTTQVVMMPNKFPFPPCHGAACKGKLI